MENAGLFRWCGSKRHALPYVLRRAEQHLRATGGRLVSLFYGSGFLEARIGAYDAPQIVAEAVPDLRALYRCLASTDGLRALTTAIDQLLASRAKRTRGLDADGARLAATQFYGHVRDGLNFRTDGTQDSLLAARFLFLVGTCFNGLWRVNGAGRMNTPPDPGRILGWMSPSDQALQVASLNARRLTVVSDWTEAATLAKPGDLILADPPYLSSPEVNCFDSYTANGFPVAEQRKLASFLADFQAHGCGVIAFNSPAAASLYPSFTVENVERSGRMNSKGAERQPVTEILIFGNLKGQYG